MTNAVDQLLELTQGQSRVDELLALTAPGDRTTGAQQFAGNLRAAAERAAPVVEDVNRSAASGLMLGSEGLLNLTSLPGRALDSAVNAGLRFVGGENAPQIPQQPQPPASALMRSGGVVERGLNYEPQTGLGRYTQTVASYVPGALLAGGVGSASSPAQAMRMAGDNVLRYGVLPGVADETAGRVVQAVAGEDSAAEPIVRNLAGLTTAVLSARPSGQINVGRPTPRARAQTLQDAGVDVYAGQVRRSPLLRTLEGTRDHDLGQLQQYTRAALRTAGINADEVSEPVLRAGYRDIVGMMDDALDGVSFTPDDAFVDAARAVQTRYAEMTASQSRIPAVRNIVREFIQARNTGQPISLAQLRGWRTRLGEVMSEADSQAMAAAGRLRGLIDDATSDALIAQGRASDVEALAQSREMFRNWLALTDASTRPGAAAGLLSPQAVHQAILRTQGRRNVATGRTTNLGEISSATDAVLRPMSPVEAGARRSPPDWLTAGGIGGMVGYSAGGELGAAAGALVGSQFPTVSQAIFRSNALQNLMLDPRGQITSALLGTSSGLAAEN